MCRDCGTGLKEKAEGPVCRRCGARIDGDPLTYQAEYSRFIGPDQSSYCPLIGGDLCIEMKTLKTLLLMVEHQQSGGGGGMQPNTNTALALS